MTQVETALMIMNQAHAGQMDKSGKEPEVLHPMAVGLMGKNEAEMVVGFLHDVVEDSDMTFEDLASYGIKDEYIEAIKVLTHDKSVPYMDYIASIKDSGNPVAYSVKLNDLANNLERGRKAGLTRIVNKHRKALDLLEV